MTKLLPIIFEHWESFGTLTPFRAWGTAWEAGFIGYNTRISCLHLKYEKKLSKINLAFHTRDTFPSAVLVSVENRKITPTVQKSMKTRLHAESQGMAQHASLSCVIWFKITHTGCQGYTQKTIQASKSFYNKDFHTRANINTSHAHKTMNTQGKSHLTKEVSPEHSLAS